LAILAFIAIRLTRLLMHGHAELRDAWQSQPSRPRKVRVVIAVVVTTVAGVALAVWVWVAYAGR
jgi:hypothetical protein